MSPNHAVASPQTGFRNICLQTLFVGVLLIFLSNHALAANCSGSYSYTNTGTSTNYNLNSGKSLKIASGTYTGNINNLANTALICVETGATFTPASLNNPAGKLTNYGTSNLKTFSFNTGMVIDNYGALNFTAGLNMNGATTIINRMGASMNMASSFQLGNGSTLTNDGVLVTQQDFNTQSGTTLTNNYRMELEGNFNPSGIVNNYGRVYAKKFMNINSGSTVTNYCSLVSYDGFNNNSPSMANFGFIVITTASGNPGGPWQNNQAFYNHSSATIAGGNFTNNSSFSGGGSLIFSGETRNQGAFSGSSASAKINFYDETQTGTQFFDFQNVAPTNTTRSVFSRPTALSSVETCSTSYKSFAPPVRRDYGDAPASYGNVSHIVSNALYMGTNMPDAESAHQSTYNAYGDDKTGTADEDGAPSQPVSSYIPLFPILKMTDTSYSVNIKATNANSTVAKLYAWIDFDHSGTFDADEATFSTVAANTYGSSITLNWNNIPVDIKLGTTFIRLRLSSDVSVTANTPASDASDGEVEDFPLAVAQHIPPDSPNVSIVNADSTACAPTVFADDFDDLPADTYFGANYPGSQAIRNWTADGGGQDTYARTLVAGGYNAGTSIYFGNGAVRRISPAIGTGFTFDANGKLTSTIDAIELRDNADDITPDVANYESDWGPYPVRFSRTFATVAGKKYRLYFDAIPEAAGSYNGWQSGIMRVDTPSGSIHFKAPGDAEGLQHYRIEFTATATSSTISFINYGHVQSASEGWCDPSSRYNSNPWCTVGGGPDGKFANELIIDNVLVAATANCQPATISGTVYRDTNQNQTYDAGENGIKSISVNLYNNQGTPADSSDDVLMATATTANDGSYRFEEVDTLFTYRLQVDAADPDLPASLLLGTPNPLGNVTVTAGNTTANQNFGFFMPSSGDLIGQVFDDVNYGGGAGRAFGAAGTVGVSGARVELYNASGTFLNSTSTAADGSYRFTGLSNDDFYVRVVNNTVKSTRAGSDGTERGIQTYRSDGKTAVTTEVGGRQPASVDAAANTSSQALNTNTFVLSGGGQAQSVQAVSLNGNVSGVNFGFNFSTVVNTNDSGQGSLRQGILNINLLANTGLAQADQDNTYGVDTSVIKEVLLFNIPSSTDPLGRTDICAGATCKITISSQLPAVAKQPAIIDATTQPGYVGGTPGIPRIHIVPATGLDARGFTMGHDAPDSTLRGFAITGFRNLLTNRGLTVEGENTLIESNYIGIKPDGTADGNGNGIELQWTQTAVIGGATIAKRNIISANKRVGISFNTGASGSTIQNNFIGTNPAGTAAMGNESIGIDTESGTGIKILDNVIAGNWGDGIQMGFSGGSGGANNITIRGNRIGVGINGAVLGNSGPGIMNYGGSSGHQITQNIIAHNLTGGIKMDNTNVSGVVMSQNAVYANGNLGIDLGNNGVTVNDANDVDSGANNLGNFPILSLVSVLDNDMTISGCAPAGATIELFEADVSVGGKASPGDNKQGKGKDYGEGQTYLTSFTEGSAGDTDTANCALPTDADGNNQTGMKAFSVTLSRPATVAVGDSITTTATVTVAGTSEFSPTILVSEPPGISGKVFEDVNYGGGAGRAFGTAGTTGSNGVQVELYNAGGTLLAAATTAVDGSYSFSGINNGNYFVRVVNDTVRSSRAGSTGAERGVQTYRTNGITAVTNEVGGRSPALVDASANTIGQTLNTSNFTLSGGGQVQSVQPVTITGNSANGVNFGFNFSTIVNTNDSGQGSLRQFIRNSNLLSQSSVNQVLPASLQASYGLGKEVSVFMVPANLLTNGVAVLTPQTPLLPSAKSSIAFDARTQTLNIGDTNTGTVGEALTAGIGNLAITPVERPEVALDCSAIAEAAGNEYCMTVTQNQSYVRGFAFYGAATGTLAEPSAVLRVTSTATATISHNLFGTLAEGTEPVWAKQNWRFGLLVEGTSSVSGNYFAYNGYGAVFSGSNNINSTFTANQMNYNGPNLEKDALNGLEDGDSLAIWERAQVIVEGNHLRNSRGKNDNGNGNGGGNGNIQHGNLIEVTNAGKAHIRNNTLINGFTANVGVYDGSSNVLIEYNILTAARGTGLSPTGSGVLVNPVGDTPEAVTITRNSIFANNGLGIDLDPGNQSQTGNRVTKNDAHDSDHGPNELLNFPFITEAYLQYGKLVLAGCSPADADIELFEADVSPGGTDAPGINKFGNAKDYGEGQIYLTTLQEGSASDTDSATCGHLSDADGNNNRGMEAFRFMITIPASIVEGDKLTATATLPGIGTSEFCLVSDGVVHVSYDLSGSVFEDTNYGGGNGQPFGTAGTVGINDVLVELYDATSGDLVTTTRTANDGVHDGSYTFEEIGVGSYYLRVVNSTLTSSRPGGNGSEMGVQTYRSDGVTAITTEIGGRHPAETDGPAQQGSSSLNTTTFRFERGPLNGEYVQSLQKIDLFDRDVSGADFGFNFDTIVNANDSGQGSLRQFLLNANLLGGENTLAQRGLVAGKESAILKLPTTDPHYNASANYWSISLKSSLPGITAPLRLDGSLQAGFVSTPVLELSGNSAGTGVNGLTLAAGSDGSTIRKLAINQFHGVGIHINGSGSQTLQANHIGVNPAGTSGRGNMGGGIKLDYASSNLIGGTTSADANIIAYNNGIGVSVRTGSGQNAILGNSIYNNTNGLGIDLNADGVSANDANDVDTGPNGLLNYPEVQPNSFGANGSKIITYDFDLDVAAGDYRLEFFVSDNRDPSDYGEGQRFIGYKNIAHPGTGSLNFKGTFNANQSVAQGAFISTTLTAMSGGGSLRSTSEFSGVKAGINTSVCTDLVSGTDANMVIDENATVITLLEAKDSHGNPITYVISGGADADLFTITAPVSGSTLDCSTVKFISSNVVITKAASADAETRAIIPPGFPSSPGNFEAPLDAGRNNVYDLQITATDSSGKKYVRALSVRVMNVNEAPTITSATNISLVEDGTATATALTAQDPDSGLGLTYRISGGADGSQFEDSGSAGILKFRAIPDYDAPTDTNRDNLYEVEVSVTDNGGLSASKLFKVTVLNNPADDGVLLSAKLLLQGAYNTATGLMSSELAQLGLLPPAQPYATAPFNYTGEERVGSMVLEATGSNAPVDWILLDLRTSQTSILATRALILQRDGDLVDPQTGSSTLHFAKIKAGNYYVSVRHRNHLGIISANPLSLDNSARMVNFASSAVTVKGDGARLAVGKLAMLWAGDINGNHTLTASGPDNDVTTLVSRVITSTGNTQANTNYIMPGYQASDLNLDGKTLFTGPDNDASLLMGNIILHPMNGKFAANYIVQGGLSR